MVDDRRAVRAADHPEVADRERAAAKVLDGELGRSGTLGQGFELSGNLGDRHPIDVSQHRHDQPTRRVDRDPDVHILPVDDLLVLVIERGVEPRVPLQGQGDRLEDRRHHGQLQALAQELGRDVFTQVFQVGYVGIVEVGHVRDRGNRLDHLGRNRPPNPRHPLATDRAPGVLVRFVRGLTCWCFLNGFLGTGGQATSGTVNVTSGTANVVGCDAAVAPGALESLQVDPQLAGETTCCRPGGDQGGVRGWRGALQSRKRLRGLGTGGQATSGTDRFLGLYSQQGLADVDGLTLVDVDLGYFAGMGAGDLDNRLVGLQFDHAVVGADRVALADQHLDDITVFDVFTQFGQFEFEGRRGVGHFHTST